MVRHGKTQSYWLDSILTQLKQLVMLIKKVLYFPTVNANKVCRGGGGGVIVYAGEEEK